MARWKLTAPHYLNVPGTTWEYKETDRTTGRQARKVFDVPTYLHPEDPTVQNRDGDVIVCYEGKGNPYDHIFIGPPTPDMEPLDPEATAISDAERPNWKHPIDSLSGNYSESILSDLQRQVSQLAAGVAAKPAAPVSTSSVDPATIAEIQAQLQALKEENATLSARLEERNERRV